MDRKNTSQKIIKRIKLWFEKYKMHFITLMIIILSIISIIVQALDRKNTMQINDKNIIAKENKIAVYITGEVKKPGVYYLDEGARLNQLLDICGGVTQEADIEQINLAQKLVDSDKINIPLKQKDKITEEIEDNENEDNVKNDVEKDKVNINTATKEELMTLDGIGETTANKIITYRRTKRFLEIEDLMNVSGIGEAKFSKIKDSITV